jgi:aldehyde:ferredoxin oxidoreductase
MNGYAGKILHVNLTTRTLQVETPSETFYRTYMGGSLMGTYYVLKGTQAGVQALSPENVLTLMLSAATGAPASGNSRMCANARSPLTDGIGDAQCGGFFPAEMKFAGFDGVVVTGRADRPLYLWLHDGQAELRDAGHLWGKTTTEVDELLKSELNDPKIEVAQCGPAGEKLSKLACIINMGNRANGRTGMGAVMGSKNLKAVVVRGASKRIPLAESKKINEIARAGAAGIPANGGMIMLREVGTPGVVSGQHITGTLPTFNYNAGQFANFESLTGETMKETILIENDTCYACSVRCKRVVETEWLNKAVKPVSGGPEYETIGTFGSYCGVDDLKAVSYANMVCNEYGLDTIGAGATIAWAMECYENGLLSEEQIGFPLKFGDGAAMTKMLDLMASREGFGDVLADGSRHAAECLGKGQQYLITSKGAEAPAHMPQAKRSLGLIYAVNPFGADHMSHEHDPAIEDGAAQAAMDRMAPYGFDHTLPKYSLGKEKVEYALATQKIYGFLDSACLCQFVWGPAWQLHGPAEAVELIKAVTGWEDFNLEEVLTIGERRISLMRYFNQREGLDRSQDSLPEKFYQPLTGSGPTAGIALTHEEIEGAIDTYFDLLGWDKTSAAPSTERLQALGLGDVL